MTDLRDRSTMTEPSGISVSQTLLGRWPNGKAADFGSADSRFES